MFILKSYLYLFDIILTVSAPSTATAVKRTFCLWGRVKSHLIHPSSECQSIQPPEHNAHLELTIGTWTGRLKPRSPPSLYGLWQMLLIRPIYTVSRWTLPRVMSLRHLGALVTSQVGVSVQSVLYISRWTLPLVMSLRHRKRQIFKRLVTANHTRSRWVVIRAL